MQTYKKERMIIEVLLIIVGLALVLLGADWLVDGASAVARRSGISQFVIGLTIVGFGTSCPELVVSVTGAIAGNGDIAIGNVMGSNIFNTLLILGLSAVIRPISVTGSNRKVDIPLLFFVTIAMICLGYNGLGRNDGLLFLVLFAAYMYFCFKMSPKEQSNEEEKEKKQLSTWAGLGLSVLGIAGLIFGGQLFVNNAASVAKALNLSDKFIAITLLAGGTSLPELVTCVVAAVKGKQTLALGNVIGSNVFNILLILGCSACVTDLPFKSLDIIDIAAFGLSPLLLLLSCWTFDKNKIKREEGLVFLLTFVAYYVWLFIKH